MKPISSALSKEKAIYRKRSESFFEQYPVCPVILKLQGVKCPTTTRHHAKGRRGKLLNDERFIYAMSQKGHALVESSPKWARQMGFTVTKGYVKRSGYWKNKTGDKILLESCCGDLWVDVNEHTFGHSGDFYIRRKKGTK